MLIACWSVKGGTGSSVVAAALAFEMAAVHGRALLVDLDGEQPLVLGLNGPDGSSPFRPDDDVTVGNDVTLRILRADDGVTDDAWVERLSAVHGPVVVDCGFVVGGTSSRPALAEMLAASATHSLLVLRPCYLALRRAVRSAVHPSGVVVIREPGRVLGDRDIADVLGAPVVASVPFSPDIARVVDAGLFVSRRPLALRQAMRRSVAA